jgi:hypothetical protein
MGLWRATLISIMNDKGRYHTLMVKPLKSFIPTPDELLSLELLRLGQILLLHLKSYEGLNTVYQHAGLNRG